MPAVATLTVVVASLCCLCQAHGVSLYKEKQEDTQDTQQEKGAELSHDVLLQLISSIQLSPSAKEDASVFRHKRNTTVSNGTETHKDKVFVDAGELVIVQGNTTDGHRQDALASTLFAQLAADFKYNRTKDSVKWVKDRGLVLGQIGWVLEKDSFREIKLDEYFVISALILKQVSNLTDMEGVCDLKRALNGFDKRIHGGAAEVLYNKTYSRSGINLAVNIFDEGEDDFLNMMTVRMVISVCEPSSPYLFHLFEPSCVGGKVQAHIERYTLNEGTYSKVRDTIVQKLGSRMKEYVIKLSPSETV